MSTSTAAVEYAVLLTGDEAVYLEATEAELSAVMMRHMEFARLLESRGHIITAGAELTPSTGARVLRRTDQGFSVTEGPYAEGAEQLGGFYTVRTTDLDDLVEICKVLVEEGEVAIEIRPCVDHGGDS